MVNASGLEEVIGGELRLFKPDVRNDPGQLDGLLDDEFVEIGASGRIWTRSHVIADLVTSVEFDVDHRDRRFPLCGFDHRSVTALTNRLSVLILSLIPVLR